MASIYKALKYDFDVSHVCEAYIDGSWYRITARMFRSFDGPRRISYPERQPNLREIHADIKLITNTYNGPVYAYMSNVEVPYKGTERVINNLDGKYNEGVKEVRNRRTGKQIK